MSPTQCARSRTSWHRLVLAACIAVQPACHAYVPGTLQGVRSGDKVRALLTADQYERLSEDSRPADRVFEGEVVTANADGLLMEVPVVTLARGIRVESLSQRFRIPADGLADLELRTLAKGRTYSLVGAAAALVGVIIWDQTRSARQGDARLPVPPDENRVTIFRFPVTAW